MKLRSVSIQNIRNHELFSCEFSDTTTLIYGKNGAGKTAILESIVIAYLGTSFRGADREVMRHAQPWYRIDATDDSGFLRQVVYDARKDRPLKRFTIDGRKYGRLPQKSKYPIVLFTPDDLRMLDGSPVRRRDYIDTTIGQFDPQYTVMRRRYERALLQRNKLVKQVNVTPEQLFSWNIMLSESGAYLINARINFLNRLNSAISDQYAHIASRRDDIQITYSHQPSSPQLLLAQYEAAANRDILNGHTSVGPHRHDMLVSLRGKPADETASRGELRTIILALKFIEAELLQDECRMQPLVLLDDVYGELDINRRESLASNFRHHQIIITSTDFVDGCDVQYQLD